MSTRSSVFVSLLAWGVFLAFGSKDAQFLSSPVEAPPPAPPQISPPSPSPTSDIHLDPLAILDGARAVVENAEWLSCDIRQRKPGQWENEGFLRRGPKGCRRFEMTMRLGSVGQGRIIVVSDGRILARVLQTGDAKPTVDTRKMPDDRSQQELIFTELGCSGPATVLAQARTSASNWTVQLAAVGDRPGVALTGQVPPTPNDARVGPLPKIVRVYLDAETLWLARAEWWSEIPEQGGVLIYETEFRQPRVNQPLSHDECERAFSYRAESYRGGAANVQ